MLYALEGCDGTGKTTLATFLSKLLDAEIVHCSTHTPNTYGFFVDLIESAKDRNIIADRWCYGQFVYQEEQDRPIKQGMSLISYPKASHERLADLEVRMLQNQVKVILVDAPTDVIKQRLEARQEKPINNLTVEQIQQKFYELKRNSLLTWIDYNTGGQVNV